METELLDLSLNELQNKLQNSEISPVELVEASISRYQNFDKEINSFVSFNSKESLQKAREVDVSRENGPLAGIPLALKDNLCRAGYATTCGSNILEGHRPPYTATAVKAIEEAGAIIVGNANMDEFAMGSSTETSAYGLTRNPWDTERVPGGSSGGSAAAVAAGIVPAALGSDTGGSIRQPAAFSGVVGFKPTYGRVSRYGLIAFASSLDQIGPITRTVEDAALLTEIISGHDPADSTSLDQPVPEYHGNINPKPENLTVGIPAEYFGEGVDEEVETIVRQAASDLKAEGAELVDVSLSTTEQAISAYYVIATAEASSNLARFDGVRYGPRAQEFEDMIDMYSQTRAEGFGAEVKRRIMLGTFVLSSGYYEAYYGKAQKVRTLIKRDFENAFEKCDLILTPTTPTAAFKLGSRVDDPVQMYMNDVLTAPTNLAGLPAITLPVDANSDGLPVAAQLIGPSLSEQMLFDIAYLLQELSPWEPCSAPLKE